MPFQGYLRDIISQPCPGLPFGLLAVGLAWNVSHRKRPSQMPKPPQTGSFHWGWVAALLFSPVSKRVRAEKAFLLLILILTIFLFFQSLPTCHGHRWGQECWSTSKIQFCLHTQISLVQSIPDSVQGVKVQCIKTSVGRACSSAEVIEYFQ